MVKMRNANVETLTSTDHGVYMIHWSMRSDLYVGGELLFTQKWAVALGVELGW